jgi:histidinol-phosphate aminotransferase
MTYDKIPERGPGLRLHLNENTAGCSPAVLAAIQGITREDVSFYPDYEPATGACARAFGVPAGWVQLTNGLDEGLHVVAQWAARAAGRGSDRPFESILVEPAFEMYAACTEAAGGHVIRIAPEPDFRFPLEALLSALTPRTRVVYLTDPNNPTGLPIPAGAVEQIAAAAPDAVVLLDEAYADFSRRTMIGPGLEATPNVVVGRTFAKAHGLAALRLGALVAAPERLDTLRPLLPPYSLNVCAIRALEAALEDRAYLEWYVGESIRSRQMIYDFCRRHGLTCWTSQANFVLVRVGESATRLCDALASRGVFVRDRSSQPGCAGCLRITAGIAAHTDICLTSLEEILASRID